MPNDWYTFWDDKESEAVITLPTPITDTPPEPSLFEQVAPEVKTETPPPAPAPHPTCKGTDCTETDHSIIIKRVNEKWISTPYCKATKAPCTHHEHVKSIWYEHPDMKVQPNMDGFRAAFNTYAKTLSTNKLYVVGLDTSYPELYAQSKDAHTRKDAAYTAHDLQAYQDALRELVSIYSQAAKLSAVEVTQGEPRRAFTCNGLDMCKAFDYKLRVNRDSPPRDTALHRWCRSGDWCDKE